MSNAVHGIKKDGVLSPVLFCLFFFNDFMLTLSRPGVGCLIGYNFVGAQTYADDIVLIAAMATASRHLLSIRGDIYS
jgi:hypothetical protein